MTCRWTAAASDSFVCDEKSGARRGCKKMGCEGVRSHSELVTVTWLTDERVVDVRTKECMSSCPIFTNIAKVIRQGIEGQSYGQGSKHPTVICDCPIDVVWVVPSDHPDSEESREAQSRVKIFVLPQTFVLEFISCIWSSIPMK